MLYRNPTNGSGPHSEMPFVSIVVSAYNEAPIVMSNLTTLCQYMASLEQTYRWELILVNDGSTDETGILAETFASSHDHIHVLHHQVNAGLGQALQLAFRHCQGAYIVTLDLDLSYAPEHIPALLSELRRSQAKIVLTSPYRSGGTVANVPWWRHRLSRWANRFLSITAKGTAGGHLSTWTGMVRAYDGPFIKALDLTSTGMDINTEILHKAILLRARITEIPAHLHWRPQAAEGQPQAVEGRKRQSSMKLLRHTSSVLLAGFLLRPSLFFFGPGLLFLLLTCTTGIGVAMHLMTSNYPLSQEAIATVYQQVPHLFWACGISLLATLQCFGLSLSALQRQRYFEDLFHLTSPPYQQRQAHDVENLCQKDNL